MFDLAIDGADAYSMVAPSSLLNFVQSNGVAVGDYDSRSNRVIVKNLNANEDAQLRITGDAQTVAEYNSPIRLVEEYNVDYLFVLRDADLTSANLKTIKANNGLVDITNFPNKAKYLGLNIAGVDDWFDTLSFDAIYYSLSLYNSSGLVKELTGSVGRTAFDKVFSGTKRSVLYLDSTYLTNDAELLFKISDQSLEGDVTPANVSACTVVVNSDGTCTLAY